MDFDYSSILVDLDNVYDCFEDINLDDIDIDAIDMDNLTFFTKTLYSSDAQRTQFEDKSILSFNERLLEQDIDVLDENFNKINFDYKISADKGFSHLPTFNAYLCRKKNHFQVTTLIWVNETPKFVKYDDKLSEIAYFKLSVHGIKDELQSVVIEVKQSNANDRKHSQLEPITIQTLHPKLSNRTTAKRLHFALTTDNNKLLNGKPNPSQRYFLLVVELKVVTTSGHEFTVHSVESDKIVVRTKCMRSQST